MELQDIIGTFREIQDETCHGLEDLDGNVSKFVEDKWQREAGGGGRSRVYQGEKIEKGGVNFSHVYGELPEAAATQLGVNPLPFDATGISIVLHALNPYTPIIHMNVRYFELADGTSWFGGGIDLSPIYVKEELTRVFHQQLKALCDRHQPDFYEEFSERAAEYFYLPHRGESRGVGGIFFDKMSEDTRSLTKEQIWHFVEDTARNCLAIYKRQFAATKDDPYGDKQIAWRELRRSRYAEFNLVWDKGTKFGLLTNGRTESILMSLPPTACWTYRGMKEMGEEEKSTLEYLKSIKGKSPL